MTIRPTPQQVAWQEAELTMFLHFGMNTFTDREWGEGNEDPKRFDPKALDARQWASVAKEAGFKYLILTAKHHDGFCLWPSKYTDHSVKSSPYKGGSGDVVREFADACRVANIKMGLYLSPWDRHEPSYGDSPAYNRHYVAQLTELLTQYGDVAEVWFDGANGEGPNGKKQEYDWAAFYGTIRKLQPKALIAISGPDVRWVGNEDGVARETEWSIQDANPTFHPGAVGGKVWWPAECDTSIRPGWFWHRAEDEKVKPLDHLLDIYFKSVGRNSVLLLNVPPDDRVLIADPDIRRLREFRSALDRAFADDLTRGKRATKGDVPPDAKNGLVQEVDLGRPTTFNIAQTQEDIREGQHASLYRIEARTEAGWTPVFQGTTIGHKKLDRFPAVTADRVRLTILESDETPHLRHLALFHAPHIATPAV
jgi:alpha-L-fucosidase